MKNNKHIIASVLLVLFSFMQLVDLHVVGHDANDTDCNMCMLISDHLDNDFTETEVIYLPQVIIVAADSTNNFANQYIDTFVYHSFLNKAPPLV